MVTLRTTSTSVSCVPSSFEAGNSTSCTASVSDTEMSGTKSTPTGTVTFSSNAPTGTFTFTPATANCALAPTATTGVASCSVTYSSTKASTQMITASYGGDPKHAGSSGDRKSTRLN